MYTERSAWNWKCPHIPQNNDEISLLCALLEKLLGLLHLLSLFVFGRRRPGHRQCRQSEVVFLKRYIVDTPCLAAKPRDGTMTSEKFLRVETRTAVGHENGRVYAGTVWLTWLRRTRLRAKVSLRNATRYDDQVATKQGLRSKVTSIEATFLPTMKLTLGLRGQNNKRQLIKVHLMYCYINYNFASCLLYYAVFTLRGALTCPSRLTNICFVYMYIYGLNIALVKSDESFVVTLGLFNHSCFVFVGNRTFKVYFLFGDVIK
ncbi:hypothetical protein Zmor_013910 [Zophobas morio]|uniref:Uncharacterized protein n=1 Tax=Zophobas morio TaxID=2755281 RepID=A0AA38MFL1_9CUCU|nr:hypothetical protein Zmor_013910 [Zophobas morio]